MTLTAIPRTLASQQILNGPAPSVTFQLGGLSGNHLFIEMSTAATDESTARALITLNGDTSNNYRTFQLLAEGSNLGFTRSGPDSSIVGPYVTSGPSGSFSGGVVFVPWAFTADREKTALIESGDLSANMARITGHWANVNAATSVTLSASEGEFAQGSMFRLFSVPESLALQTSTLTEPGDFSFSDIDPPNDHLVVIGSSRSGLEDTSYAIVQQGDRVYQTINGSTASSNYRMQRLTGEKETLATSSSNEPRVWWTANENAPNDSFGSQVVLYQECRNSDFYRTHFVQHGAHDEVWDPAGNENGRYQFTSAISSLSFKPRGGDDGVDVSFSARSRAALYRMQSLHERHVVAAGGESSVTLSVPEGADTLSVLVSARSDRDADDDRLMVTLNGSGSGYARQRGTALSGASEADQSSDNEYGVIPAANTPELVHSSGLVSVFAPSTTDRHKHIVASVGASDGRIGLYSGVWEDTGRVTEVTFAPKDGDVFVAGSVFQLVANVVPAVFVRRGGVPIEVQISVVRDGTLVGVS